MKGNVVKVERYGEEVWENDMMDTLRKEECLCLNCGELGKCDIAKEGLELCKKWNCAFAMTRCKEWSPKNG